MDDDRRPSETIIVPPVPAGRDIVDWLRSRNKFLSDLDGNSKQSKKRSLEWNGEAICSVTDCSKLNSYDGLVCRRSRPFLDAAEIVRLAAYCRKSAFDALALTMKNAFEKHVKRQFKDDRSASFGHVLVLAHDTFAMHKYAEPEVCESFLEALRAVKAVEIDSPGTFLDIDVDRVSRHSGSITSAGMASLRHPASRLANELESLLRTSEWAEGMAAYSAWGGFDTIDSNSRLACILRQLDEYRSDGMPLPFAHYHDLQGNFLLFDCPIYEDIILSAGPERLASLHLACAFVSGDQVAIFNLSSGCHSVLSPVRAGCAPVIGMVDHLSCLKEHLSFLVPESAGSGVLTPLGLCVRVGERLLLTSGRQVTCARSIYYLYVVRLPGAWPLRGCRWTDDGRRGGLPESELALLEAIRKPAGNWHGGDDSLSFSIFRQQDSVACTKSFQVGKMAEVDAVVGKRPEVDICVFSDAPDFRVSVR